MLEMFVIVPLPKPLSSSTIAAPTTKGPLQTEADIERGHTTTISTLEAVIAHSTPVSMLYVSAASIQAMAQRQARTKSQLT